MRSWASLAMTERKRDRGGRDDVGAPSDSRVSSTGKASTARCERPRTSDVCVTADATHCGRRHHPGRSKPWRAWCTGSADPGVGTLSLEQLHRDESSPIVVLTLLEYPDDAGVVEALECLKFTLKALDRAAA